MFDKLIRPTGPCPAPIAFIGEAGGETEYRKGKAFQGKAGQLFDALLWSEAALPRDSVYVDNIFPYWTGPGNPDPPISGVLEHGAKLLIKLREEVRPKVIVTLGRISTRYFLGDVDMEAVHGLPLLSRDGLKVFPAYHPAAGLHQPDLLQFTAYDFQQLRSALKAGEWKRLEDQHPKPDYWLFSGGHKMPLDPAPAPVYVDTEGVPGRPYCLTFTTRPGSGCLIRATDMAGLRWFRSFIARRRVVMHNAMWDLEMLREMGIFLDPALIDDTMVKAFNLRTEPQGLKPLAFRHAGMQMQSYDDLTLPYDNEMMEEFLVQVAGDRRSKEQPDPVMDEDTGKIKQPQSLNRRVWNILSADKDRLRKAWLQIEPEIRGPFEAPPFDLSCVPFDKVIHYACRDADATCRIDPILDRMVDQLKVRDAYRLDMDALPLFERMQANGMPADRGRFQQLRDFLSSRMADIRLDISKRYNGGLPINPDSGPQVAKLLYEDIGLKTARMTKSRSRPSTDDKALEALRGQHPSVELIGEYRSHSKMKQFADGLPKYLGADGRVRGSIRITRVVTGRPSMSSPNLFAIPVRDALGRRVRSCFKAEDPNWLGTCDLDQIEMRVMAELSRDKRLVKLFNDGKDIHADTASKMFGIPLAQVDPVRHRYPAKRVGFGVITGIQDVGLLDQMHLAGIQDYSQADCQEMIDNWFAIYPGVWEFMKQCRLEAKRKGFVRDAIGRIRLLPAVRSPFEWQEEEALRQSHSMKIQGTAAVLMKRAMKRMWDLMHTRKAIRFEPLLQIYDEIIVEFHKAALKEVEKMMLAVMTADSGSYCVPIKAKFAAGPDWGSLEK